MALDTIDLIGAAPGNAAPLVENLDGTKLKPKKRTFIRN